MDTLILVGIPLLLVAIFVVIGLAIAFPYISRAVVKSTGAPAEAVILSKRAGKGAAYGSNRSLIAQEIILKLEVHPAVGAPYETEIRYMEDVMNAMRLEPGYIVQVRVARGNPDNVAVLAETSRPGSNASNLARAQVAVANFAQKVARGEAANGQGVMETLQAEGVRAHPMAAQDDLRARLEKLTEMMTAGLITQQEFETKKAEILAKI
ncbi:MAG: SHOCT domain-containing protein [Chloroflexi bacterium]|nr:SHOCT domain-containing protein [Chloroflexota bacterium]